MMNTLSGRLVGLIACILAMPGGVWAGEPAIPTAPSSPPLTLSDCYALALKRSEEIAIHQELIAETEGRFLQALSGVLPRASFSSSDKRQDASGESAFKLRSIPERKFVFSQPLFSGFKEFAAMGGSRAERRERLAEKARAEGLLLIDVADAFYLLLEQQEDLGALAGVRQALIGRLDELNARERLGRTRPSELASAEAQLRRVEAEVEGARSQELTTRQLLEFLTGLDHLEAIADSEPPVPAWGGEDEYVTKAQSRPDVRAAEEAWRVAQHQVRIAQAKFFPNVGLEGNYYTKRVGVSEGVSWDALLKVDVPIFQGGQNLGAVQEASSRARQAKLQFTRTQRAAVLDIRDTYAKWQAALERHRALQQALDAAQESYRLQVEDYRLSLVNNLQVLQALQALEDAHRELIHARYEATRLSWRLRVATGESL